MMTYDPSKNELASPVWRDMLRLHEEMNSLFSRVGTRPAVYPAVNLWTNAEGAVVTAELPGVILDDLELSVIGDTLTIKGSRQTGNNGAEQTYHRHERGSGRFARTVQLPFRIEASQVSATLRNGVLQITLPMAEADRPRKINVKNA